MALNEAAMAVGLESEVGWRYMQAADKLSSFLVRAQVSSTSHPYLHGTWLRGFDVSTITISCVREYDNHQLCRFFVA